MKKILVVILVLVSLVLVSLVSYSRDKPREKMIIGVMGGLYYPDNINYLGGTIYNFTFLYLGNKEKSIQGFTSMYKFNSIFKFIDIDLGLGLLKEDQPVDFNNPYNDTSIISLTANTVIGINILQLIFKQKNFVFEPNVILSTKIKPVYGITVGLKL